MKTESRPGSVTLTGIVAQVTEPLFHLHLGASLTSAG